MPYKILYLEDEKQCRDKVRKIIEKNFKDCELIFAEDANQAIELYNKIKPDLIISDIGVRRFQIFESYLHGHLKRGKPVIFYSGSDRYNIIDFIGKKGVAYVRKRGKDLPLIEAIRKAIKGEVLLEEKRPWWDVKFWHNSISAFPEEKIVAIIGEKINTYKNILKNQELRRREFEKWSRELEILIKMREAWIRKQIQEKNHLALRKIVPPNPHRRRR